MHSSTGAMSEREERRFVEIPRESVRLMAESTGLELSDEVAALLAEDVCYRLREATQNSSQFMKHTKRRKLTVEDFNRALRWSSVEAVCGYGSQEVLPLRPAREGELYFPGIEKLTWWSWHWPLTSPRAVQRQPSEFMSPIWMAREIWHLRDQCPVQCLH